MNIIFKENNFCAEEEIEKFSSTNSISGSIASFIGKVRPKNNNKNIKSIEIEIYEEMAYYQMNEIIKKLKKDVNIQDFLVIHRFGKIFPGENIVLVIVASEHRRDSFKFLTSLVDWLKIKVTFWKKENYTNHSEWVEQKVEDKKVFFKF